MLGMCLVSDHTVTVAMAEEVEATAPEVKPSIIPKPVNDVINRVVSVASWYGPGFHGRRTANGEQFNQHAHTAAHKTLPFGTRVRVTHRGKSVVVRINDRGPYVHGRGIDLSQAAAHEIGLYGVAPVQLEVLGRN